MMVVENGLGAYDVKGEDGIVHDSYSHYSGINYSALEVAVRRIQQDFDFLMRYLPKLPGAEFRARSACGSENQLWRGGAYRHYGL